MLSAVSGQTPDRLLGLFHTGNMDGWVDRHQWKGNTVKKFPNQPDLTESFDAAVKVLEKNKDGFFLMLEAGLVDKYSTGPAPWATRSPSTRWSSAPRPTAPRTPTRCSS